MGKEYNAKVVDGVCEYCYYSSTQITKEQNIGNVLRNGNNNGKWKIVARSTFDLKDADYKKLATITDVVKSDEFDHNPTVAEMVDFSTSFNNGLEAYIASIKLKYSGYNS